MKHTAPPRDVLDPIEIASRDEISALQLERMKWSLRHAYQRSPLYQAAFDAAGVHPHDLADLPDLARFPFTLVGPCRAPKVKAFCAGPGWREAGSALAAMPSPT